MFDCIMVYHFSCYSGLFRSIVIIKKIVLWELSAETDVPEILNVRVNES